MKNNKIRTRNILRWVHLIGAALIGTYVYAPWSDLTWFTLTMQIGVIPALTLTGMWMWKPHWFRGKRKKHLSSTGIKGGRMPATLLLIGLAAMLSFTGLQAQKGLKGGSGGFLIGFKSYNTSAYQYFVEEGGPQLSDNLLQVGGEGYFLLNRFVLGGGGYYSAGNRNDFGNVTYQIQGGGGYAHLGYAVHQSRQLIAFPLLGIGFEALGINRRINTDITYDPGRFLEAGYAFVTPTLDIGTGIDWFPGNKGFKLGLRAGYNLSLSRSNDWRHEGGEVTNPNLPDNDLDGFYLRLTIGGGYLGGKSKDTGR